MIEKIKSAVKFIFIFLLFAACKNKLQDNQNDIVGKWEGTIKRSYIVPLQEWEHKSNYEIEFTNKNDGWEKYYDHETNEPYDITIFKYYIKNDTIFFKKNDGNIYKAGIDILTEKLLIYSQPTTEDINNKWELKKSN